MVEGVRLTANAREVLVMAEACSTALRHNKEQLEKLASRVPYGLRDMRLVISKLSKLLATMWETIPTDQRRTIENQMRISKIAVITTPTTGRVDDNWVISREDLEKLLQIAAENKCFLCENPNGKCELRRLMRDAPADIDAFLVPCMK